MAWPEQCIHGTPTTGTCRECVQANLARPVNLLTIHAQRIEKLESALRDGLELFDNYGFADESPCVRDREIVANMRAALGETV